MNAFWVCLHDDEKEVFFFCGRRRRKRKRRLSLFFTVVEITKSITIITNQSFWSKNARRAAAPELVFFLLFFWYKWFSSETAKCKDSFFFLRKQQWKRWGFWHDHSFFFLSFWCWKWLESFLYKIGRIFSKVVVVVFFAMQIKNSVDSLTHKSFGNDYFANKKWMGRKTGKKQEKMRIIRRWNHNLLYFLLLWSSKEERKMAIISLATSLSSCSFEKNGTLKNVEIMEIAQRSITQKLRGK